MRRRTKAILIAVPLLVIIGMPMTFLAFWFAVSAGSDAGSPELAREWRDELSQYQSAREAQAADQSVEVVTFENGQWIFGRAQDSHGIWRKGGGTLVVSDSNGETRAFHGGHVCGPSYLMSFAFDGTPDLNSFYSRLSEHGFQEYRFE